MMTTQNILIETNTTDLFSAYEAIAEGLSDLGLSLQASYRFSPVQTGRVVRYSRRDVMELGIRRELLNTIDRLTGMASWCAFELDATSSLSLCGGLKPLSKGIPMKDQYATTFHRDGTVTVWSTHQQRWIHRIEPEDISDTTLATLSEAERQRIARLIERRRVA